MIAKMTSLKRHETLQPLSRDHVIGLHQAQLLQRAAHMSVQQQDLVVANFALAWKEELQAHFEDEEAILPAFIGSPGSRQQLYDDHVRISRLAQKVVAAEQPGCSDLEELGRLLDAHIRWEEHHLFPEIEASLTAQTVAELKRRTDEVESKRIRHSGKYAKRN